MIVDKLTQLADSLADSLLLRESSDLILNLESLGLDFDRVLISHEFCYILLESDSYCFHIYLNTIVKINKLFLNKSIFSLSLISKALLYSDLLFKYSES